MTVRAFVVVTVLGLLTTVPCVAVAQESHCALGQHVYGNASTSFNGVPVPALLDSLITPTEPLVLGAPGRSLSFLDGSEPCLPPALPAASKPAALPEDLGDAIVDASCVLPEALPSMKQGKLRNALLGESIALSLNVRLDPGLAAVTLDSVMMSVEALPGEDGLYGTGDDVESADGDTMTIRMPGPVLAAVEALAGPPADVGGLLAVANAILAGEEIGEAGPRLVWKAVKDLNRLFTRCRFLIEDVEDDIVVPILLAPAPEEEAPRGEDDRWSDSGPDVFVAYVPGGRAVIRFSVPERSTVSAGLYTVSGRLVARLVDGSAVGAGSTIEIPIDDSRELPSGVYFVRLEAAPAGTDDVRVTTGKAVLVR